jgi:hypothetical protein
MPGLKTSITRCQEATRKFSCEEVKESSGETAEQTKIGHRGQPGEQVEEHQRNDREDQNADEVIADRLEYRRPLADTGAQDRSGDETMKIRVPSPSRRVFIARRYALR